MSWDLFVYDIPPEIISIEEVPDEFEPKQIGTRTEVIASIQQIIPTANFSRPDWGTIDAPDYSIELSMGHAEEISHFAMHVRGGDRAACVVALILNHLKLRAFDPSAESGIFGVDPDLAASLRKWRRFRDQIVG